MFDTIRRAGAVAALMALGATSMTGAKAQSYIIEGASPASLTGIIPQTLAQYAAREGVDLQVVLGQTATRSVLKIGARQIGFSNVPPPAFSAMRHGVGPYADQADAAQALSENVRSLFAFPGGTFHAIVWADSGIESWDDVAGRRIYIGPPAGAASAMIQGMVELSTGGLRAGEGYEGMRAPWGAAQQAFQDGQYDVYVAAVAVGQQALNELSLTRPIRILGVPEEIAESDVYAAYLEDQSLAAATIPAGTYEGQVNNDRDLFTPVPTMMMATHDEIPEEVAYTLTRIYWENLDEMVANNALMRTVREVTPFQGVNAPLHPGALRYYREVGIDVPEALLPEGDG